MSSGPRGATTDWIGSKYEGYCAKRFALLLYQQPAHYPLIVLERAKDRLDDYPGLPMKAKEFAESMGIVKLQEQKFYEVKHENIDFSAPLFQLDAAATAAARKIWST